MSCSQHTHESSQKAESVQQKITNHDSALPLSSDDEETESEITNAEEIETNQNKTETEELPTEFSHTAESTAIHNTKNSCANTRDDLSICSSKLHHVGGSKVICSNPTVDRNDDISIGSPADDEDRGPYHGGLVRCNEVVDTNDECSTASTPDDDVKIGRDETSGSKQEDSSIIHFESQHETASIIMSPTNISDTTAAAASLDIKPGCVDRTDTIPYDDDDDPPLRSIFNLSIDSTNHNPNGTALEGLFRSGIDEPFAKLYAKSNAPTTTQTNHSDNSQHHEEKKNDHSTVRDLIIPLKGVDITAMKTFHAQLDRENLHKWICPECSSYNSNSDASDVPICNTCDYTLNQSDMERLVELEELARARIEQREKLVIENGKEDNDCTSNQSQFEYHEILESNGELLEYDATRHPQPRYFPYQHDEKEEELEQEGAEAWRQFDDDEDNEYQDITKDDQNQKDKMTHMVQVYRQYKFRRSVLKTQINGKLSGNTNKIGKTIHNNDVVIVMAGDGSMSGALGVGNGNVTSIKNNISTFPFLMTSLLGKKIKCTAAGIMSTAVVTMDDELYVWGLNDKSELTINPHNLSEVDVGCDDDQLSPDEAWKRLFSHYERVLTAIYQEHNPSKLNDPLKPRFIATLLEKRKIGRLFMKFNGKAKAFDTVLMPDQVNQLTALVEKECRLKAKNQKKMIPKRAKVEIMEEIDVEASAEKMHTLYLSACNKYNISEEERLPPFIPEATTEDMLQRKKSKLDLFKRVSGIQSESDEVEMDLDDELEYEPHSCGSSYIEKQQYEDAFQPQVACSWWTPAHVRLPTTMVIKQVTLGATHMVILDNLGRVFSSGTFSNDGPIGHHYDAEKDEVIRYQRELKQITNIQFLGDRSKGAANQGTLPRIKAIASGANHILMLDDFGDLWQMGAVKLGQRWCQRNVKQYLCPQRIPALRRKGRRVYFKKIACGNHHNLAISNDGELYSWGQNVWLQCGHPKRKNGYGDVVGKPEWVPFYRTKRNVNDEKEENVMVDYHVVDVVAGEHMTVALDKNGNVWTCGRNACYTLGRKTRNEGIRVMDGRKVRTEVQPDLMRKVIDLETVHIDWIGCGSVVWFAHSDTSGAVYAFGDASSGRAGIGQWQCARGRPVFDEYNLDLSKFEVTSAHGGCDHVIFTIERRMKRRHSEVLPLNLNERYLSGSDRAADDPNSGKSHPNDVETTADAVNLDTLSVRVRPGSCILPSKRGHRKRTRKQMEIPEFGPLIEEPEGEVDSEPANKKPKLARQNAGIRQCQSTNF